LIKRYGARTGRRVRFLAGVEGFGSESFEGHGHDEAES
jgi:hypothetical protein